MKNSSATFKTQTEQELRDIMGGSLITRPIDKIGGIMLMYGISPTQPSDGWIVAKYGVFISDTKDIK